MSKFTSPDGEFSCIPESRQCEALTTKEERCKRLTRQQLPYCYQHAKTMLGLQLGPSKIKGAGKGIFALKPFARNAFIAPYGGELIDEDELQRRYKDDVAAYAFQLAPNLYLDAACSRGVGSMSNTSPGNNNAIIARRGKRTEAALYASKPIGIGDEILTDYGPHSIDYVTGNLRHTKEEEQKTPSKKTSKKKSSKKKSSKKN